MVTCRYVGGDISEIGDREFDAVGQVAEFSEHGFVEAICGGAMFLPQSVFDKVKFTEQELAEDGPVGDRDLASTSFCEKLLIAQHLAREIRSALLSGRHVDELLAEFSGEGVMENSVA